MTTKTTTKKPKKLVKIYLILSHTYIYYYRNQSLSCSLYFGILVVHSLTRKSFPKGFTNDHRIPSLVRLHYFPQLLIRLLTLPRGLSVKLSAPLAPVPVLLWLLLLLGRYLWVTLVEDGTLPFPPLPPVPLP